MYKLDKLELRRPQAAKVSLLYKLRPPCAAQPYANPPAQRLSQPVHLHDRPHAPGPRHLYFFLWRKQNPFSASPQEKKKYCFSPSLYCSCSQSLARRSAAGPPPFARPLLRPPHKQKNAGPQHSPRTRSPRLSNMLKKSVDFPLKKSHVGTHGFHALASAAIDGPHLQPPFFLSPFLQRKRKKKTEVNSAGSNTSLGLTSFVLTMYALARRASSAETNVAKNADFCKIFDTPYISL